MKVVIAAEPFLFPNYAISFQVNKLQKLAGLQITITTKPLKHDYRILH